MSFKKMVSSACLVEGEDKCAGVASQLGLRRLDRVISLNGKSMTGTDASGVRDAVQNAERPLQILLARELVAESDTPDKAAVPEEVQDKESPDETTDLVTALDRILPHGEDVCAALSLVALVGGGGKTTLVFQLARSLAHRGQRVCVTTTTKMYLPQAESNTQQMPDSIIISQHYTEASARLSAHFVEAGVGVIFLAAKTIEEPGSRTKAKEFPDFALTVPATCNYNWNWNRTCKCICNYSPNPDLVLILTLPLTLKLTLPPRPYPQPWSRGYH